VKFKSKGYEEGRQGREGGRERRDGTRVFTPLNLFISSFTHRFIDVVIISLLIID